MRKWVVRFASLYVFNLVVLLLVGILPSVRVGWAALWGSVILTAATLWIKPLVTGWFTRGTDKSSARRTKAGEWVVRAGVVYVVELIVWIVVVLLSGVRVNGILWGWILPPLALLIAWAIYAAIDDRVEAKAGELYDRATGKPAASVDQPAASSSETTTARAELHDGLTAEQRRMLDELGS